MSEREQNRACHEDEIDLIELAQALWAEKKLVLGFIAVTTLAALAYSFSVSPQYSSTALISPAPVNAFGVLAGELKALQSDKQPFGINAGVQVANDVFSVLQSNLTSLSEQQSFREGFKVLGSFDLSVTKGRSASDAISISATSGVAEQPKDVIDSYLSFAARITAAQINEYLAGLGISQQVEPGSLYRLEQPAAVNSTPVKPKRVLIIALGFILGGMLGVFVALVRIMLKKRLAGAN